MRAAKQKGLCEDELAAQVKEFQEASGIPLSQGWPEQRSPKEIGRIVKLVLRGEHETDVLESRLRRIRENAQSIVTAASDQLGESEA